VDIDEVVVNFLDPYLVFISAKYGRKVTRADIKDGWRLETLGIIPKGSGRQNLLEFAESGGMRNLDFMPGAEKGLSHMANCHSIAFVTSREPEFQNDTVALIERIDYGHVPIYFSNKTGMEKSMIIQGIGANYLIDDNPTFINETRARVPQVVSILMTQIPAALAAVPGEDKVSGWEELRKKHPELFTAQSIYRKRPD
jgi:5'(3')-deoxyribonucleotidase